MDFRTKQGNHVPKARPCDMRDYRFWFDANLRKWCVSPAEGSAVQVLVCDELLICELDAQSHPDGTWTCKAELVADGSTLRIGETGTNATCRKALLRLYRSYDQVVHIPVGGSLRGASAV